MWTKAQKEELSLWAKALGRVLRRRRKEIGATQAAMAAAIGVSRGFVSRLENGHARMDILQDIARFLGMECAPELFQKTKRPARMRAKCRERQARPRLSASGSSKRRSRVRSTD